MPLFCASLSLHKDSLPNEILYVVKGHFKVSTVMHKYTLMPVREPSDEVLKPLLTLQLPYFPVVDEMGVLTSSLDLILLVSQEMRFQLLEGRSKISSL